MFFHKSCFISCWDYITHVCMWQISARAYKAVNLMLEMHPEFGSPGFSVNIDVEVLTQIYKSGETVSVQVYHCI